MPTYFTLRWQEPAALRMIDQRSLPHEVIYHDYYTHVEVAHAIHDMVVRGAPAIGVAAAYGLALAAFRSPADRVEELQQDLESAAQALANARPTAVNLFWAIQRIMKLVNSQAYATPDSLRHAILALAHQMAEEDVQTNKRIGLNGQAVVPAIAGIVHHCNTGALATVDYGTALGVIRTAHELGKQIHVYVDETRPRLQGARLTAWELKQLEIHHTVIVDGSSGFFMRQGKIQLCLVGCDRIAINGDTANKVGTYNLALAAAAHAIPFFVVGPTSTIDRNTSDGDHIPIEERPDEEITQIGGVQITPDSTPVSNPAFDVTPAKYITGIITEKGIARSPYRDTLEIWTR